MESNQSISRAIERALSALNGAQDITGCFKSVCFADAADRPLEIRETVFPSCLIASCISICGDKAVGILPDLTAYIFSQKSLSWSWNYTAKNPLNENTSKYPDDLDDTSTALISLFRTNRLAPHDATTALAAFARNLIRAETTEGGPYRTWLVEHTDQKHWLDVDIVVNANIAYFLGLQGVSLDNLNSFIDLKINRGDMASLYYHSKPAVLYFLSRAISIRPKDNSDSAGNIRDALIALVKGCAVMPKNALESALIICALLHLGAFDQISTQAISSIIDIQLPTGLWPLFPLYIEEIREGKTYYCGSEALTTAFCVEALTLYADHIEIDPIKNSDKTKVAEEIFLEEVRLQFDARFKDDGDLCRKDALLALKKFQAHEMERFVALLPYHFSLSLKTDIPIDRTSLCQLALGNLFGWIGYTLQDSVTDEYKDRRLIPLSNLCIRRSQKIFEKEASGPAVERYIATIFDRIDRANALDLHQCALSSDNIIADKSFGHSLGPLIMLMRIGYGPEHPVFISIEGFFREYIIARQMNDDAHDWEEDLGQGHLNSASSVLLKHLQSLDPSGQIDIKNLPDMRMAFWNGAIDEIVCLIRARLASARAHIEECGESIDPSYLESLLRPLDEATNRALLERNKALDFLIAFKKPPTSFSSDGS